MTTVTRTLISLSVLLIVLIAIYVFDMDQPLIAHVETKPQRLETLGHGLGYDNEQTASQRFERNEGPNAGQKVDESEARHEIKALRDQYSSLRADLGKLQNEVAKLTLGKSAMPEELDPNADAESFELSRKKEADRANKEMELVENEFRQEYEDKAWAEQTRNTIQKALESEHLAGQYPRTVECRSTRCRVEISHDDPQKLNGFVLWLPQALAEVLPNFSMRQIDETGGYTTQIFYFSRSS